MTPTPAQIEAWRDVIAQAMACIKGETPEDISFGEAEDDTFSKLREVEAEMSAALAAAKVDSPRFIIEADHDVIAATIERCAQVAKIRTFTMYRRNVPDATHNAFQKNAPDQPQFEGVIWSDGTCTIRWMTAKGSTSVWNCFDDMMAIHGHPEYGSEIEWHDAATIRALKDKP